MRSASPLGGAARLLPIRRAVDRKVVENFMVMGMRMKLVERGLVEKAGVEAMPNSKGDIEQNTEHGAKTVMYFKSYPL